MMEESTEGTISRKKCLKGDGPIDIDSDEAAIQGSIAFAKRKKQRVVGRGSLGGKGSATGRPSLAPDQNFIGVILSALGKPERVMLEAS